MITQDIALAAATLEKGECVAIPTETVYGLAANALDGKAVAQIFALKKRPLDHPLIVHVKDLSFATTLVSSFPEKATVLAKKFWPGPLTLVLPKKSNVPDLTTGGLQSVAIRVPQHPKTLALLSRLNFPLAAPSANPFGSISPTSAEHVESSFGKSSPLILDGGKSLVGVESTIVSFLTEPPVILRLGGLSVEEIEAQIGKVELAEKTAQPIAPGMLAQHYAPKTPLILLNESDSLPPQKRLGLITFKKTSQMARFAQVEILSSKENLAEAASNLYSAMRKLDAAGLDIIVAYRFPDAGLGRAINDRLERASGRLVSLWDKSE